MDRSKELVNITGQSLLKQRYYIAVGLEKHDGEILDMFVRVHNNGVTFDPVPKAQEATIFYTPTSCKAQAVKLRKEVGEGFKYRAFWLCLVQGPKFDYNDNIEVF